MKILLFVSSKCSHCPEAERIAKQVLLEYHNHSISFEKVRVRTSEGKNLALKYNVMSLPSMLLLDDEGNETKRIVGTPKQDSLKNDIEKQLGLKKSFFSNLFGK